ncbi:hypothetical protein TrST_g12044 [Triparma strigata]|uniref:ABC transporter domain-containing protein n=1 Tax=Triparma strigata TaxID=1606541 RepID=A0A9W7E0S2_9STRA|nr:hypothetical protein TrST_g12044 [Triparma strigata]
MAKKPKKTPEEKAAAKVAKSRLFKRAREEWVTLSFASVAFVASTYANASLPKMLGRLLDDSSSSKPDTALWTKAATLFCIGGLGSMVRTALLSQAETRIIAKMKNEVYTGLITADLSTTYDKDTLPSTTLVLHTLVPTAAHSVTSTLVSLFRSTSGTFNGMYMLFSISPQLTMYSGIVVPCVGVGSVVLSKLKKKYKAAQTEVEDEANKLSEERLMNLPLVKLSNTEEQEKAAYADLMAKTTKLSKKTSIAEGLFLGTMFSATGFVLGGVMRAGGKLCKEGKLTPGQLTSYATYTALLGAGAAGVAKAMSEFGAGVDAAVKIYGLIDKCQSNKDKTASKTSAKPKDGSVIVKNLTFKYPSSSSTNALSNVSLNIESGEIVAIIGENGSGKTTLTSIIAGLYPLPSGAGSVTVGGADVGVSDCCVGVVPQNSSLLDLSVFENVMYGKEEMGMEECRRVCDMVGATKFVEKLEGGFKAKVGRGGCKLSGGQRQRLALARAFVGAPPVVILDEPNTHLDEAGEGAIKDTLASCKKNGTTLLVVTHQEDTVKLCGRSVKLEGGVIS